MLPPPSMQELLAASSFGGLLMSKPLFASIVIMLDVHTSHPRRSDLCQHALVSLQFTKLFICSATTLSVLPSAYTLSLHACTILVLPARHLGSNRCSDHKQQEASER